MRFSFNKENQFNQYLNSIINLLLIDFFSAVDLKTKAFSTFGSWFVNFDILALVDVFLSLCGKCFKHELFIHYFFSFYSLLSQVLVLQSPNLLYPSLLDSISWFHLLSNQHLLKSHQQLGYATNCFALKIVIDFAEP